MKHITLFRTSLSSRKNIWITCVQNLPHSSSYRRASLFKTRILKPYGGDFNLVEKQLGLKNAVESTHIILQ